MPIVLFIVGCAQRSRDGVADYTYRLATELTQRGVSVRILAWSDPAIQTPVLTPDLLRLPSSLPWRAKLNMIKPWYDQDAPDKISLQFVPYAYAPSGLPGDLARQLAPVIAGKPLHVLIHELWVMPCMRVGLRDKLKGIWQRKVVLEQLRALNPELIHTAVPLYRQTLEAEGFAKVRGLPLFGNIPPVELKGSYLPSSERRFGIFGSIHAPLDNLCAQLTSLAQQTGLPAVLRHAGGLSPRGMSCWQRAQKRYSSAHLRFERIGFLARQEASSYFQTIHALASTYSPVFYTKSGVIAAAREHNKPVWLLGSAELSAPVNLPEGVFTSLDPLGYTDLPQPEPYFPLSSVTESYYYFLSHS